MSDLEGRNSEFLRQVASSLPDRERRLKNLLHGLADAEPYYARIQFPSGSVHGGATILDVRVVGEDDEQLYVEQLDGIGPTRYRFDHGVKVLRCAQKLKALRGRL